MTSTTALLTVVASALLATVGGSIGYGLGVFVPGYYRGLYEVPGPYDDPKAPPHTIDPVQIGLGATQGFSGGIIVGLIVVFLLTCGQARSL